MLDKQQLEYKRHTLAHLLAAAVQKEYPNAKLTLGPAVDNAF
jgi:threonyl-tRNA synthetase